MPIKVEVRSNESLEAALRRFKRQCNSSGVFRQAKANTWHEKNSDKLRRERRERMRTILKAARRGTYSKMGGPRRSRRESSSSSSTAS
jgi:small subunit ribosomal protein S21